MDNVSGITAAMSVRDHIGKVWIFAGGIVTLAVSISLGAMALAPPDLDVARGGFIIAGVVLMVAALLSLKDVPWPLWPRVGIAFLVFGTIGVLMVEALSWVSRRDRLMRTGVPVPPAPQATTTITMFDMPGAHGNTFEGNTVNVHTTPESVREAARINNAERERRHADRGFPRTLSPGQRHSLSLCIAPVIAQVQEAGAPHRPEVTIAASDVSAEPTVKGLAEHLSELGARANIAPPPVTAVKYRSGTWVLRGKKRRTREFDDALVQGLKDAGLGVRVETRDGSTLWVVVGAR